MKVIKQISKSDIKKYGVKDWALHFDGINAPEAGVFLDDDGYYDVGDIATFNSEPVVITHKLDSGDLIATHAHDIPNSSHTGVPVVLSQFVVQQC